MHITPLCIPIHAVCDMEYITHIFFGLEASCGGFFEFPFICRLSSICVGGRLGVEADVVPFFSAKTWQLKNWWDFDPFIALRRGRREKSGSWTGTSSYKPGFEANNRDLDTGAPDKSWRFVFLQIVADCCRLFNSVLEATRLAFEDCTTMLALEGCTTTLALESCTTTLALEDCTTMHWHWKAVSPILILKMLPVNCMH